MGFLVPLLRGYCELFAHYSNAIGREQGWAGGDLVRGHKAHVLATFSYKKPEQGSATVRDLAHPHPHTSQPCMAWRMLVSEAVKECQPRRAQPGAGIHTTQVPLSSQGH